MKGKTNSTLLRHLFGPTEKGSLAFEDLSRFYTMTFWHEYCCCYFRFVDNLQTEVLRTEFDHTAVSSGAMRPFELGAALLKYSRANSETKRIYLQRLESARYFGRKVCSEFDSLFYAYT